MHFFRRNEKDMAQLDCMDIVNQAQAMDEDLTKIVQLISEWNERVDCYLEKAKRKTHEIGRDILVMKTELDKSVVVSKMKALTKGTRIGEVLPVPRFVFRSYTVQTYQFLLVP